MALSDCPGTHTEHQGEVSNHRSSMDPGALVLVFGLHPYGGGRMGQVCWRLRLEERTGVYSAQLEGLDGVIRVQLPG